MDEPVSTGADERGELLGALRREVRLLSSLGVLFSEAVAEHLGINSTDMESLDFVNLYGPMTPGRMGQLTGLSSGGVTRLIDRLERAGYVRREADAQDRRKVIIAPLWEASDSHVMPLFAGMAREMGALMESYSSDDLRVILGFMQRSTAIASSEITRVRALPRDGGDGAVG